MDERQQAQEETTVNIKQAARAVAARVRTIDPRKVIELVETAGQLAERSPNRKIAVTGRAIRTGAGLLAAGFDRVPEARRALNK